MKRILSSFALLLATVFATPVAIADNVNCPPIPAGQWPAGDMTFRVDNRNGNKVLIANGAFGSNAAAQLDSAIRANMPIDEIWFNSPGGVASQGTSMGRSIREWGIPTRVPSGYWCVSACNFAFLGGPIRSIDEGGVYAVHMFTNRSLRSDVEGGAGGAERLEEGSARRATEQNDFMIRMGVSRRLLEVMYDQPAAGVRCLTHQEMQSYNVVNF